MADPVNARAWFLSTSFRTYAMTAVTLIALALAWYSVDYVAEFMTADMRKELPDEYVFDIYKRQIDGLKLIAYFFIGIAAIGVIALTSTNVKATSKLGSFSVDTDDDKPPAAAEVTVTGDANVNVKP